MNRQIRKRICVPYGVMVVGLTISCGPPRSHPSNVRSDQAVAIHYDKPSWHDEGVRLLESGRCTELRTLLDGVPQEQRTEEWYVLSAMDEALCWTRTRMGKHKAAALQAIESGITRYPDSALLIANKGALLETFGDVDAAMRLYNEAYSRSKEHLRDQPDSRTDRYV